MHTLSVNRLCERLKSQGRRLTPQRRVIVQALLDGDSHPTAEQVFAHVSQVMPDMSQATVYNTLRELVEVKVLQELDLGLAERHYDFTIDNHAHLVCLECGRVEDVLYDSQAVTLPSRHTRGFQVIDCNVIFRGYCPACKSRENPGRV